MFDKKMLTSEWKKQKKFLIGLIFEKNIVNYEKNDIRKHIFGVGCVHKCKDANGMFFDNEQVTGGEKQVNRGFTLRHGVKQLDLIGKNRSRVWVRLPHMRASHA